MEMPVLRPVRMDTKDKPWYKRLYTWLVESRKWELMEDYVIDIGGLYKIFVPRGFIFDGASVPKLFWPVLSPTGILLVGGLVHDFAYRFAGIIIIDADEMVFSPLTQDRKSVV